VSETSFINPSIRIATKADACTIAEIGRAAFAQAFGPLNTPEDLAEHLETTFTTVKIESEMESGSRYLLAELEDAGAVGFLKLPVVDLSDLPDGVVAEKPIEIHQLYLRQKFRRLGFGTTLLTAAEKLGRDEGCDGMFLGVWEKATWAHGFYKKNNMTQVGTQIFRVGDDNQIDLVMYKSLLKSNKQAGA